MSSLLSRAALSSNGVITWLGSLANACSSASSNCAGLVSTPGQHHAGNCLGRAFSPFDIALTLADVERPFRCVPCCVPCCVPWPSNHRAHRRACFRGNRTGNTFFGNNRCSRVISWLANLANCGMANFGVALSVAYKSMVPLNAPPMAEVPRQK
jgi:hypothetical protein